MAGDKKHSQLGRGLAALLGEDSGAYAELDKSRVARMVPLRSVPPGPFPPRPRGADERT